MDDSMIKCLAENRGSRGCAPERSLRKIMELQSGWNATMNLNLKP